MKINNSTIEFVWDIAQKEDSTIAGINGIARLSNNKAKIYITLWLDESQILTTFYFLETKRITPIKNPNQLIGFMYKKDAPKEFIDHATKESEEVFWLSKNDLCLALIDMMNFIKG